MLTSNASQQAISARMVAHHGQAPPSMEAPYVTTGLNPTLSYRWQRQIEELEPKLQQKNVSTQARRALRPNVGNTLATRAKSRLKAGYCPALQEQSVRLKTLSNRKRQSPR